MCSLLCFVKLVVVTLILRQDGGAAKHEPACSKYDYEEKMLEKLIRMEMKMEQVVNEIKGTKEDMSVITNEATQKVEKVEQNNIKYQRSINESISSFFEQFEEERKKITTLSGKAFIPIIAFNTRLSSILNLGSGIKVVFDTVLMNEGEGYDRSSGIFSVSQSGLYFFAVHLCNNGNNFVHYKIVKDDQTIAVSTQLDSVETCSSVSTVVMLNTGERVWVQTTYSSLIYTDAYKWCTFVGVLLNRPML